MSLLEVRDLQIEYSSARGPFNAVDGVSFSLERGEIFGLAGESGCGKSTTAYGIGRLLRGSARVVGGSIRFDGVELTGLSDAQFDTYRWARISIVLQSAMNNLNPVMKVKDQLTDAIFAHRKGVSRADALRQAAELMELVDLPKDRLERFPHELSGGMRQRVVIAMALALRPELIIMDEPTTALDVITQKGIIDKIIELKRTFGFSVLFITHDLPLMLEICDRVGVMYAGQMAEIATRERMLAGARHPYTQGLLRSFPSLTGPRVRLAGITGSTPDLVAPPQGCRFRDRCLHALPACGSVAPPVRSEEDGIVSCHLYAKEEMRHEAVAAGR
ncbi:peptide/nickel transport system ATP-binding protein [Cohnella sp. OV330]|uniref:ABC transporter ATP-binding protein n=1 Tax=Cohnella sp. OV330 TaxID=1855288 RepID=UPI0008EE4109|nr:ABC transporter ATP-binding protein [Cohnella sp. OV330]SFB58432.1 peptide/nickel transport system ATP-binding protein [Cohnella sp. OV330]